MRIYFAGGESIPKHLKPLVKRVLLSFAAIKNKTEFIGEDIFLDSGAFSVFTGKSEVTKEQYAKFLQTHKQRFTAYANFDVIGDYKGTAINQSYLESQGHNPIPVFHYGSPYGELKKLASKYKYILLGGLVPLKKHEAILRKHLDSCFAITGKDIKIHGLGVGNWELLARYPFYSCDSTSWLIGSKFKELLGVMTAHKRASRLPQYDKESLRNHFQYISDSTLDEQNIKTTLQNEKYLTDLWKKRGIVWQ